MRKQKRGIISVAVAMGLCIVMGLTTYAGSIESIEESIDEIESEVSILESQRYSTQMERDAFAEELDTIIDEMIATSEELALKEIAVEEAEMEFAMARADEDDQLRSMKKRIRFMYESGGLHIMETLLSSQSMGEFLNAAEYISQLASHDREMLIVFEETVEAVAAKEAALREDVAVLSGLRSQLIEKQEQVEEMLVKADLDLANMDGLIGARRADLDYLHAKAEQERQRIADAEAAAAAEAERLAQLEAEREAANNQNGNGYGGNGGNVYSPPPPPPSDVATGGGQLAHPLPGWPISSGFGWREFDNAHHNGIDIAAPEGTPFFAAESGTVIISGFSGSAGNWIVLNHGNGMTTVYMHNSLNQVSVGQQVGRGQQIGLVGNTGNSFGAHLHFEVRISGVPHNPLNFL